MGEIFWTTDPTTHVPAPPVHDDLLGINDGIEASMAWKEEGRHLQHRLIALYEGR